MTESKLDRLWLLASVLLITAIVTGSIILRTSSNPGQPLEISRQHQEFQGEIYVGGNVTDPSFYPLSGGDTLENIIKAAGGTTSANPSFRLYITDTSDNQGPQKIDINRADAWLLEALPGIGETLARRIVDYRLSNGPFRNINGIGKVAGIDSGVFEKIKDLITVVRQEN